MRAPLLLVLLLSCGCASSHAPPPGVRPCPLLVVGEGETMVSYGGLAGRSADFEPGSCVEIYVDDERVARTIVTPTRSFALQFQVRGDARAKRIELRMGDIDGRQVVQRYELELPDGFAATIAYEPNTTPLVALEGGQLEFTGWLGRGFSPLPIADVWLVNWSRGEVAPVGPTPTFGEQFTARVAGGRGECASPLSSHIDEFGGCWWPRGNAGCAPHCTLEDILAGRCGVFGEGTCTGRGCDVIDVDERRSGAPPPELPDGIATALPDGGTDAGPPDGGPPPDAELM